MKEHALKYTCWEIYLPHIKNLKSFNISDRYPNRTQTFSRLPEKNEKNIPGPIGPRQNNKTDKNVRKNDT